MAGMRRINPIPCAEIEERISVCGGHVVDAPNEDRVVAGVDDLVMPALKPHQTMAQVRHGPFRYRAMGKLVPTCTGEARRGLILVLAEDVNGVRLGGPERLHAVRSVVQAPQHERRVDRNCREAGGGDTNW